MTIQARGDSSLVIWDMATGKELARIKDHTSGVADFVFAPDGQTLITVGNLWPFVSADKGYTIDVKGARIIGNSWYVGENSIVLRDTNTGKEIRRFADKRPEKLIFKHIALSADGKTLAGGGSDGVIYLWDMATGKEIQQLKNHQADLAQKDGWTLSGIVLAFTPDGKRLVSAANKRVLIWDMQAYEGLAGGPGSLSLSFKTHSHTYCKSHYNSSTPRSPSPAPAHPERNARRCSSWPWYCRRGRP